MGKYNVYLNDMKAYNKTSNSENMPMTDYYKNLLQYKLDQKFTLGGYNIYKIKLNDTEVVVKVDSLNAQRGISLDKDEYKEITFQNLNQEFYLGDIIEFKGLKWIVIITSKSDIGVSCTVRRCNIILRYMDDYGNKYDVPCAIKNTTDALLDKGEIILQNDELIGYVPYNNLHPETKKIALAPKRTRFIINGDAYNTYSLDCISYVIEYSNSSNLVNSVRGFMKITFKSDVFQAGDIFLDNDKFSGYAIPIDLNTYELRISQRDLSLNITDTLQLNAVITRDKTTVITNEEIIWESSDKTICTISNIGLVTSIKEGNCTISAKMKNNENVKDNINVNITSSAIVDTYTTSIVGNEKIVWGYGSKYTCYKYKNNTQVTGGFTFSIDDLGNTGIASLSVVDDNNVSVKVANDVKYMRKQFKLVAVDKVDGSIKSEKVIGVKGLT